MGKLRHRRAGEYLPRVKDTESDERDAIIDSIVCSQGLAGVPVTREMAAAALDRALQKPLATIG